MSRRSFLKGSALFAAALAAGPPAWADDKDKDEKKDKKDAEKKDERPREDKKENPENPPEQKEEDPFAEDEKTPKQTLLDADGREYRVCPQCGANMYRQGRTWTCSNCGYSYVE